MKVRITHMKAPWPEGAKIGDVLEVSEVKPWALGKCVEVGEGVEVTFTTPLADAEVVTGDGSGEALPPADNAMKTGKGVKK